MSSASTVFSATLAWNDHGRPGPGTSPALLEMWRSARALNETAPGRGEWVPWRAVRVNTAIMPRLAEPDPAIVERYAEVFDALPPIVVQKDSFVLIDGQHRLAAAAKALRDHIRILEVDAADDDLEDLAIEANIAHGLSLTPDERRRAARRMYNRHNPDTGGTSGDAWSAVDIARRSGVHRNTVGRWLEDDRQRALDIAEAQRRRQVDVPDNMPDTDEPEAETAAPRPRVTIDERGYEVRPKNLGAWGPRQKETHQDNWMEVLASALARTPRDVAAEVDDDDVAAQIVEARRASLWLRQYADALARR